MSLNYDLVSKSPKNKNKEKLQELINEACPDILWTIDTIPKEQLPSLQHLALQRNVWAKKRTIMANKRTMLAFIRTGFTLANMAKSWGQQSWSTFGLIFISFVAAEYIYNIITITANVPVPPKIHTGLEYAFDAYAFGLVVVALIILGYEVPQG